MPSSLRRNHQVKETAREFRASIGRIEMVGHRYAIVGALGSPEFVHSPGQFTQVIFEDQEGTFERYYSIASAPRGDGSFELCLILDDQRTRQIVETWSPGSTLRCKAPAGRFPIPSKDKAIVGIAGGSGITPLKAIIEDRLQHKGVAHTALLYGCQNDTEIPFYEDLQDLARQHPAFQLQIYADQITLGRALAGRPLDHLDRFIAPKADYLLCGPPAFMQAARGLLLERGVAPDAIHQDRY
jgi:ferredoxin-NADP reductase